MKPGAIHDIESLVPLGDKDTRDLVLVMHDDEAFLYLSPTILVVPLVAMPEVKHGHPYVKVAPTPQNGLKKPLVAVIDRLHDVDRARIGTRLGEIDRSTLIDVYRILDRLIGRHPVAKPEASSGDTRHVQL